MVRPDLRGLPIYKMTGSGNDFVMIDGRVSSPADWTAADIQALCGRGTGVGADGLVFVSAGSAPGAVRMVYLNSDGSRAAMCGNAALCSSRLAAALGVVQAGEFRLEADAGTYLARYPGSGDVAELHLAPVEAPADMPDVKATKGERRVALGIVGVPHLVVLVDSIEDLDLMGRGRALREDPALAPGGANINFVARGNGGPAGWTMRTYERGVEAETLACGTGAVAVACALDRWGLAPVPTKILSRSGRVLEIRATREGTGLYGDVWLKGEARLVFRGVLE